VIKPTPEQLAVLSKTERMNYYLADQVSRNFPQASVAWNTTFMSAMLSTFSSRRLRVEGLENLKRLGPRDRVLLVSNHRSFFDFFVITAVVYWYTTLPRRILFPVRGTFFYDQPLGTIVNAIMSGLAMFPPMMRAKSKATFNAYSVARCVDELRQPGIVMGLHPEGTRSQKEDPYSFLPAKPGVGRIAIEAEGAHVIPIFILGIGNQMGDELKFNWKLPEHHPIDVVIGSDLNFDDLRALKRTQKNDLAASQRCLDEIGRLGEKHKATIAKSSSRK
jgi:1-acyl-sn-glycerol-3-phosphate acyltransferase